MTLIAARVTPRGVWLTSDMRIIDPGASGVAGFFGAALKLVLLGPELCIAYAGRQATAIAAIRRLHRQRSSPAAAVDHLLEVHLEDPAVDFLVAALGPQSLTAIKDGAAEQAETAWLGDPEAFGRYQELFHGEHLLPPSEGLDPLQKADLDVAVTMNDAMQDLVLADPDPWSPQPSHPSVGEASVTVGPRVPDGFFGYHRFSSYVAPFGVTLPSGASLSSTEHGTFTMSILTPLEAGVAAIGLHFREGSLGILYAPLATESGERPERLCPVTLEEFIGEVESRFGIRLVGSEPRF
jgi:hypothetical protein